MGAYNRPRLKDRITDDSVTRESPDIGGSAPPPPSGIPTRNEPPLPSGGQIFMGGLEGQGIPAGTRASLKQRLASAAGSGIRGAVSEMASPSRVFTGHEWTADPYQAEAQRVAGQRGLESQREAYSLPEQQARIEHEQAGTEQQRLSTKILQRRLEMMQGAGGGTSLQDVNEDEQALLSAAYATGDPKTIEQAVSRIYSRRAIEGMVGPGTNVYDPNAPGGVSRQFMTKGGGQGPTVSGAVVPATLPRTTVGTQLVPTESGGMVSVPKPTTTAPVLPGTPRAGGGGGGAARPVMGPGGQPLQPRLPAQEERAQQTAILAVNQLPAIKQEILAIKDKLGPLQGRVMEIRRVIGNADPNYTKVVEDTDAAVSAFSVIHFGARGNWQWLNEFKSNVDAGTLTYPNLVAGWQVLERWLRAYQTYGTQRPIDEASGVDAPGVTGARR